MLQDQVASNKKSSSRYCCYKKEITGVNYGKVTVFVRIRRRYYCYKKKGIRAAKTRGRWYCCYKTKVMNFCYRKEECTLVVTIRTKGM